MSLLQINPQKSLVLVIDVQQRLLNAMPQASEYTKKLSLFLKAFETLGFNFLVTEQYPRGLGATDADILASLPPETAILDKTTFSCLRDEKILQKIEKQNPEHVIIVGMEAHVCVYQTVCDLTKNYTPVILEDALLSRKNSDRSRALKLMEQEGHLITTFESLAMAIVKDAKEPAFKAVSNVLKQL